jgi:3-oxoacyl-[acyl-carrier-protein] synthase II
MTPRVAITGAGLISPLGDSSAEMFNALCEGRSGVLPVEPFIPNGHRCHLAGRLLDFRADKYLSGRPLRPLDRTSQLATSACSLALLDSGWTAEKRNGVEMSLVLGTMLSGMHTIAEFDRTALTSGPASVSPMAFANTVINAAAGQAAIWHNLRGANSTVAAGSVSGICAVGYAADALRQGRCNALLAGGVDEFSCESFVGFDRAGLLCSGDADAQRPVPFDRSRNGFALGEGSGVLVLEELDYARKRDTPLLAEVKGCASVFDCSQGRDTDLAVATIARAMRLALNRSGMVPADIDFVSASANGSVLWDCFELKALAMVFGDHARELPVTAIKSGIGEALGASGAAQIAAAFETFRTGLLPGVNRLEELPPGCPLSGIHARTIEIDAGNALINGVGLDGHCFSMILSSLNN